MSQASPNLPIPNDLTNQLDALNDTQQAFLAGYLWAKSQHTSTETVVANESPESGRTVMVLSASQTGNAARVAKDLSHALRTLNVSVTLKTVSDFKVKQLSKLDILLLVTSTQGEGEPPEEAIGFYNFLYGKRAPDLSGVSFCVFGLGDSSYPDFCKASIDFDTRFAELGATRLTDRIDADVDYESIAVQWIDTTSSMIEGLVGSTLKSMPPLAVVTPLHATTDSLPQTHSYSKTNPFLATVLQVQDIASADADRRIAHVELDLADSAIQYQPGDSLGVITLNDHDIVNKVLRASGLSGEEKVESTIGVSSLRQALTESLDLNQLRPTVLELLDTSSQSNSIPTEAAELRVYLAEHTLLQLLRKFPGNMDAQSMVDAIKPLTPRFYSIASAQTEVEDEVHLCVALLDLSQNHSIEFGTASGMLCNRLEEGDQVKVFVDPNPQFRLPHNPAAPIIMIGAGTGIAPFRAFMQQREADLGNGRNWLIFGNRHSRRDFLYQAEWLAFRERGLIDRWSLAWSRDTDKKVYVQDKVLAEANELWSWIEKGAYIYICGDASHMAKAVEQALLTVFEKTGNMESEAAQEFFDQLREDGRYQRDVY